MYNSTLSLYNIMKRKRTKNNSGSTPTSRYFNETNLYENKRDYVNRLSRIVCSFAENNIGWFENNYIQIIDKINEADKNNYDTIQIYRSLNENILPFVDINISNKISKYVTENLFNDDNKESIVNTCNNNKIIDRLLWNHNLLKESVSKIVIVDNKSLNDILYEMYSIIDEFFSSINDTKKLFLCIEESCYMLDSKGYKYNSDELIYEFIDLFRMKNIDESSIAKVLKNLYREDLIETINESEDYATSEDVKKLIEKYKKQTNKDTTSLKRLIETIYGKTPTQVIDETPSIFKLIRIGLLVGSFSISPVLGIIHYMTDKWIEMTITRTQCDRMYKIFSKEKERIDEKEMFSDELSPKMKSYSKCLEQCMDRIDDHRRKLYTDAELDNEDSLKESFEFLDEVINKRSYIIKDYNNKLKQIDHLCNKVDFHLEKTDIDIIELFNNTTEKTIGKFIDGDDRLRIPICDIILYDEFNSDADSKFIDHICSELVSDDSIVTYTITDNDNRVCYNLSYVYNKKIETDSNLLESIIKSDIHIRDIKIMNTIIEYGNLMNQLDSLSIIDKSMNEHTNIIKNNPIELSSYISNSLYEIIGESYRTILEREKAYAENSMAKTVLSWAIGIMEDNNDMDKLDSFNTLKLQIEAANTLNKYLTENINKASLKMAGLNLTSKAKELSQKEKETSAKFNVIFNQFQKNIERSLTTDKRESIIKGSVVPSASKCVKAAIATGAAYLVNPALAVIGALGALAISKKLTKKERQILMDEIEVELKYVEKEISLAESDGNSKKYKQLLLYQKKLQREYQRINYNIRVSGGRLYKAEGPKREDD